MNPTKAERREPPDITPMILENPGISRIPIGRPALTRFCSAICLERKL